MLTILYNTLAFAGTLMTLLGCVVFILVFIRPMKAPADTSNRIAHLRLVWFAMTKPHLFTKDFPDLTNDEEDNFNG